MGIEFKAKTFKSVTYLGVWAPDSFQEGKPDALRHVLSHEGGSLSVVTQSDVASLEHTHAHRAIPFYHEKRLYPTQRVTKVS